MKFTRRGLLSCAALVAIVFLSPSVIACTEKSYYLTVGAQVSGTTVDNSTSVNVAWVPYGTDCWASGYFITQRGQNISWAISPWTSEQSHDFPAGTVGSWSETATKYSTCGSPGVVSYLSGMCSFGPIRLGTIPSETPNMAGVGTHGLNPVSNNSCPSSSATQETYSRIRA